jgi:hypothetical protein
MRAKDRLGWFPLVVSEFDDVPEFRGTSLAARGVVFTLLLIYWKGECKGIPSDKKTLATLIGCSANIITRHRSAISVYFIPDDKGLLKCKLLDDKWVHAKEVVRIKRKSANERYKEKGAYADAYGGAYAERMQRDIDADKDTEREFPPEEAPPPGSLKNPSEEPAASPPPADAAGTQTSGSEPPTSGRENVSKFSRAAYATLSEVGDSLGIDDYSLQMFHNLPSVREFNGTIAQLTICLEDMLVAYRRVREADGLVENPLGLMKTIWENEVQKYKHNTKTPVPDFTFSPEAEKWITEILDTEDWLGDEMSMDSLRCMQPLFTQGMWKSVAREYMALRPEQRNMEALSRICRKVWEGQI